MEPAAYAVAVIIADIAWWVIWGTGERDESRRTWRYRMHIAWALALAAVAVIVAAGLRITEGNSTEARNWLFAALTIGVVTFLWAQWARRRL